MKASGDAKLTRAILEDYTTAPDAKLRTTLGFIEKLAQSPSGVTAADVRPLLEAGVSREAVADAVYVLFLFSIYTRLSDTLGWDVPSAAAFEASARILLERGY